MSETSPHVLESIMKLCYGLEMADQLLKN
jgi:hypothetical protein